MLSIVIPVFNEENSLGQCLDTILTQPGDYEIIIVDGGSNDNTLAVAQARTGVRILTAIKGRGSQMNAGAQAARGDWLLFLHADTLIEKNTIATLTQLMAKASFEVGCFWHRFDSRHPWLRIVSLIHNLRFRFTHIIYGDQGLLIRRELFTRLNGFKESIVMEDIEFSERLRQVSRPICLPLSVITSARKFRAIGIYRATLKVLALMHAYGRHRKDTHRDLFFSDIR
ncbi:MAG: TIGR04283 family arsenosugar biosynthesis glycosyltransferase [Acidobacteriota bacterium]